MSLFLIHDMLTHSLGMAKEIAKGLEMKSSKIEKETTKHMEEIKLPKFKTKEELEQFAMGLMTENESLKNVIKRKDSTIKELDVTADRCTKDKLMAESSLSLMKGMCNVREEKIKELESEIKSLKENPSEDKYMECFYNESRAHTATRRKYYDIEHEFSKTKKMVHKLCSMVTFMFGLLPRFKAERVTDAFGEFHIEDYRL